jgi:hypothetical protein
MYQQLARFIQGQQGTQQQQQPGTYQYLSGGVTFTRQRPQQDT